ncbi:hypothetical protein PAI11_41060 [Patulibacter medicamentivorans]|uniref:Uncharacterized protein n=1 Tax=Patulibacter medicamentivorans TaxID=1097667 RepID=H0EB77_9ACTN|nr:hypothetical protein PAI11_41060 [Patulibacter medicamentivorans]
MHAGLREPAAHGERLLDRVVAGERRLSHVRACLRSSWGCPGDARGAMPTEVAGRPGEVRIPPPRAQRGGDGWIP